jgi:DNA helicase-2/ATP-dependent DNA helicase PcrA
MAVQSFYTLWDNGKDPLLIDILRKIKHENLLALPDILKLIAKRKEIPLEPNESADVSIENDKDEMIDAWDEALSSEFSQLESYANYITDNSRFGTHQGIKGLEFPRVMVILDDEDARGFLFSYDKLLGAKEASATDEKNELEGKETIYARTRRLFYVTCSRAKESLAVVAYTGSPEKVKSSVIKKGWFSEDEIIEI